MPNHVTNILTVSGDPKRMAELFEAIKTEEYGLGSIDFAKIIPVPDTIYQGSLGKEEMTKYGKNNWLDWNTFNWGSKWNSYGYDESTSAEFDGESLRFLTVWSNVHQVIGRLAEMYPDLEFSYCWADEDFGNAIMWAAENMRRVKKPNATSLTAAPKKPWSWPPKFIRWI